MTDQISPSCSSAADDDHEDMAECLKALVNLQSFLHGELAGMDADEIRHHLDACERCMDTFDVEATIAAMLKRCCGGLKAPNRLRISITRTIVEYRADGRSELI